MFVLRTLCSWFILQASVMSLPMSNPFSCMSFATFSFRLFYKYSPTLFILWPWSNKFLLSPSFASPGKPAGSITYTGQEYYTTLTFFSSEIILKSTKFRLSRLSPSHLNRYIHDNFPPDILIILKAWTITQ
jgi:hypothetical protein